MSDERAVQQVLAKYVRGADARDGAAVAALFTETGRVEIMKNTVSRLAQNRSIRWEHYQGKWRL